MVAHGSAAAPRSRVIAGARVVRLTRAGQGAGRSAALAVGFTVLCALPLFLTSAFAVELQRDLGFDRARLGWCVSAYFLASSAASAVIGGPLQRAGPAVGLRAAAGLTAVSLLGIATVAGSWVHLALLLGAAGVANAVAQVGSNLLVADGIPTARRGVAFGVKQAAVPLGSLLAGLALPAIALTVGWRWGFAGIAGVAAAATLRGVRVPGGAARRSAGGGGPRSAVLVLLMLAGATGGGVGNSLVNFTVDAAVTNGMAQSAAGLLLSVGALVAITFRVGSGLLVDRRDAAGFAELATLMLTGAAGLVLLALGRANVPLTVAGTLVGFAGTWGWQGLIYYVVVRRHPEAPAAATGLVQAGVYLGTIAGPPLIGQLATDASYQVAWALAACVSVFAGVVVLVASRLAARRGPAAAP
jgi:MFS family permease